MGALLWIVVILVILAIGGAIARSAMRKQRSQQLRGQFVPEYDHMVQQYQDPRSAERALEDRQKRVDYLQILPLATAGAQSLQRGVAWCAVPLRG
jgi:hypothetical protein